MQRRTCKTIDFQGKILILPATLQREARVRAESGPLLNSQMRLLSGRENLRWFICLKASLGHPEGAGGSVYTDDDRSI